jgi:superoxide dismutase
MHYSTIPLFHDSIIPIFHHSNIPMLVLASLLLLSKTKGSGNAFLLDYKPAERAKYIDAFFANIDWNAVEQRMISQR